MVNKTNFENKNHSEITICEGCGLQLPMINDVCHSYMLSSPACWKIYNEVLAREYGDNAYSSVNRLTVDSYALQHPGTDDRRAIKSVNTHLASLYLIFEKNHSYGEATAMMTHIIEKHKVQFTYLKPPKDLGNLTIYDVWKAKNAEEHIDIVKQWAKNVWDAWSEYHQYIARLAVFKN